MLQVKKFTVNAFSENTYVLFNEDKLAVIIDPGMYTPREENKVFDFIAENNLQPIQIINTHCHIDHVLGVQACIDKYNIPFGFNAIDQQTYDWAEEAGKKYAVPLLSKPKADFYIAENAIIKIGNDELEVRYTPGHSIGHIIFYNAANAFVIVGDVIFENSIGRTDLPGGNFNDLIKSIHTQVFTLPNDTIIYCGHGPNTTVGLEKMNNPYVR